MVDPVIMHLRVDRGTKTEEVPVPQVNGVYELANGLIPSTRTTRTVAGGNDAAMRSHGKVAAGATTIGRAVNPERRLGL